MAPTEPTSTTPLPERVPVSQGGTANEKSREVRLGLVLYGGVSLAIYINGVSHEFFRAVRGRGIYRFIKALTDSDVVVDVISGTSAGGINGIFLAFALCNEGAEFKASAPLWSEHGDIRKLLRAPNDRTPEARLSLLDTERNYKPNLVDAFLKMYSQRDTEPSSSTEDPSVVQELDLFITGTDVDGRISTQFDDAGHLIDVKDHRTVFYLKHRQGREDKQPFRPQQECRPINGGDTTVKALAKLACITSCFPAAFSPVMVAVKNGSPDGAIPPEDGLLQQWGRLSQESGTDYRCFLDGGVLDNKPFSYTIKSIFSRHAVREVDRKLCYVEPDPELFEQKERRAAPEATPGKALEAAPDALQAVLAAVVGIPRYESIGDDLQLLSEHNNRVMQYRRIVSILDGHRSGAALSSGPLKGESEAGSDKRGTLSEAQKTLYIRSRLVSISERVLKGLLRDKGKDTVLPLPGMGPPEMEDRRKLAAELTRHFEEARVDTRRLFEGLDVTFRLRRLYHTVYTLYDQLYEDRTVAPDALGRYQALLRTLNRQIELHEILLAAMEQLIDEAPIDWFGRMRTAKDGDPKEGCRALWNRVLRVFERLLDGEAAPANVLPPTYVPEAKRDNADWLRPKDLARDPLQRFHEKLRELSQVIVEEEKDEEQQGRLDATWPPSQWRSLLARFKEYERDILDDFVPKATNPVRRAYEDFDSLDAVLFPLEAVGGVHEKDVIETIRISPRDAAKGFSAIELKRKVAGDAVYHFGGFFKRSWRSNDILWGRLDGLCQLVEILLDRDRLARIASNKPLREVVRGRFFPSPQGSTASKVAPLTFKTLFPHSGAQTRELLDGWLGDLLCEGDLPKDRQRRESALEKTRFEAIQALLIEAAQLEVLVDEVPNVINDAITEQAEWNNFQVTAPIEKDLDLQSPPPWAFYPGRQRLDPLVQVTGAAMLASQRFERLCTEDQGAACPRETALGRYFRDQYKVGGEQLQQHVPKVVLLGILTTALLVLNNCVLAILGERARSLKRSPIYLLGVYLPLRSAHGFISLIRADRALSTVVLTAILVLSLVVLPIGVVWWDALIAPENQMQLRMLLLFIVVPVLLLAVGILVLWALSKGSLRSVQRRVRRAASREARAGKKRGRGPTPPTQQGQGPRGRGFARPLEA